MFMAQSGDGAGASALPKVPESSQFWLPNAGSDVAESVDALFHYIYYVSAVSVLAVFAAMIYFAFKFRATSREANEQALSQEDHSNVLEVTWSVIPLFFVITFFVWGFKDYVALRTPPKDAMEIYATGQKWQWTFKYPNGHVDSELHVPQGENVRVVIKSVDVLHSLYIPEYRVKMDAVPGRYTELWFRPRYAGEFPIFCAEYCGTSHSDMLAKVVVHEEGGYEKWMKDIEKKLDAMEPVALGQLMYKQFGCGACHSTDGTRGVGPSFKGVWGKNEALADGQSVKVDENYLRESILEPQAKVVAGFAPQMPSFKGQMSDKKIDGLIAYIRSLQ